MYVLITKNCQVRENIYFTTLIWFEIILVNVSIWHVYKTYTILYVEL